MKSVLIKLQREHKQAQQKLMDTSKRMFVRGFVAGTLATVVCLFIVLLARVCVCFKLLCSAGPSDGNWVNGLPSILIILL